MWLGGEGEGGEPLSLQDFCENFLVTGATGSGKSSGSGRALADAMLAHGFGGLVLTVKPDERQRWEHYLWSVGRSEHLVVVEAGGPWRLNFLDYATKDACRVTDGVEEVVELFHVALDSQSRTNTPRMDGGYWEKAGKQLLRNAVRVLRVARGRIVLDEVLRLVSQAPTSRADLEEERWRDTGLFGPALEEAERLARGTDAEPMVAEARRYWLEEFPTMRDGQRGSIVSQVTALSDVLFQPGIRELLCAETTLLPEAAMQGAVILIDLPLLDARVGTAGAFVQAVWKHLFQRAVQSRRDPAGPTRRPVFLWADEAQYFVNPQDGMFASTSRSSRCSVVMLTQNLPNLYAAMSGGSPQHQVDGLLGNLVTKVVHANTDLTTNRWASELIGQSERWDVSVTLAGEERSARPGTLEWMRGGQEKGPSTTSSRRVEPDVRPEQFLRLATGGEQYGFEVEAFVVRGGRTFGRTGKHYLAVRFTQEV
jgi:NAD(P)-dependent dehydrogenase (short-subunit alcohol dehydrogenase family)